MHLGVTRTLTCILTCTVTYYTIMRKLKYHERKLLRKVNLYSWKCDKNIKVAKVLRRYHIQDHEDYITYNHIVGNITQLAAKLKKLKQDDVFRIAMTDELLLKLFNMGIITSKKSLQKAKEVTVSAICRRRLSGSYHGTIENGGNYAFSCHVY